MNGGTTFLLLSLLSGSFGLAGADRSRPRNVTPATTTTPSPRHEMTPERQDPTPNPSEKKSTAAAAAAATTFQNPLLLKDFNRSQLLSSLVLRTKAPDLTNKTVLHAHRHEGHVIKTKTSLTEVALGESEYFINKLFQKYGSSEGELTFKGLRDLMTHIGLFVDEEDGVVSMVPHAGQEENGEKTVHRKKRSGVVVKSMARRVGQNVRREMKKRAVVKPVVTSHSHGDHSECHALGDLLSAFHFDLLTDLDPDQFLLMCPALIDQLDNSGCHRHGNKQHQHHDNQEHHHHDHGNQQHDSDQPRGHPKHNHHPATPSTHHNHPHDDEDDADKAPAIMSLESDGSKGIPVMVWVYSSGAVAAISLVGLLGVAVIPIIRGRLYKVLLQFLIALAVGALSGDALLHLLPHALSPAHPQGESDHHDDHLNATASSRQHDDGGDGDDHGTVVWKGLVALLGLLFFFLAERILTILTAKRSQLKEKNKAKKKSKLLEMSSDGTEQFIIVPSHKGDAEETPIRETAILTDDTQMEQHQLDDATQHFLVDDNNHDHHHPPQNQGQDHGHGHSHGEVPRSMSAVVVMVIFGDGIHNFSDGLAIGAAFANSVTGGLSTAVAVFCHELPHEIGDFAMLLSAGMTWKRAMLYNMLSSVLCLMGMVVGVFLGNLDNAVLWIFPAVAGMFLYISLADMLPELALAKEKMVRQLLIQCAGIAIGAGIMLIIAIFEHDLKTLLD